MSTRSAWKGSVSSRRRAGNEAPTAVVLRNSFIGVPSGTDVTPANSGGASGDAFTTVSGSVIAETSADLTGAYDRGVVASLADSTGSYAAWSHADLSAGAWFRVYLRRSSLPTVNTRHVRGYTGTTNLWELRWQTDGEMALVAAGTGDFMVSVDGATSLNTVYRVEGNPATRELRVFVGDSTTEIAPAVTSVGVLPAGVWDGTRFGVMTTAAQTLSVGLAAPALSDLGWLGPASSTTPPDSQLQVYGANSSIGTSFTVQVTSEGQTLSVPVELVRPEDQSINFARFAFSGTATVTVAASNISQYSVSPKSYGITPTVNAAAGTMTFTISNTAANAYNVPGSPIKLAIHNNYGDVAKLFIFGDPLVITPQRNGTTVFDAIDDFDIQPGATETTKINNAITTLSAMNLSGTATLVFPTGLYYTSTVNLKNNVTLYLTGKATLMNPVATGLASHFIRFTSVSNAHVRGPGILNANIWHEVSGSIVHMRDASNCSIQDATLTGTGGFSVHIVRSNDILGKNYKLINQFTDNSDGTDPNHSQRVLIDGIFEHTKDDAFAVKTSGTESSTEITDDIEIRNTVVWTQKSALKVGSEVGWQTTNVRFINNNVVACDRGLALYGNGNGTAGGYVDDILFSGNYIERNLALTADRIVDFRVKYMYPEKFAPFSPISNVIVEDTVVYENAPVKSSIAGSDGVTVSNVTFTNFRVAGTVVTSANYATYFTVGTDTSNITFSP